MYSSFSQRMSGITLNRSASAFLIVAFPASVRPTDSGPRARQKTPSSAKNDTMRSTSRLLNAAEIAFINSMVTMSCALLLVSGQARPPQDVAGAVLVEPAAQHEEVVGQPVQIL